MRFVEVALCAALAIPGLSLAQSAPPPDAAQDLGNMSIEDLLKVKVQGAALHPQSLEEAPASVTIITADDIATYGYRTLGEALASVRGFYVIGNYTYESVGVRGFNFPGDYGSRILVMVDGHNMADNVFNYNLFFGNDFPLDMNLVKQIEIIRGPSSALYGSNGIFATINIITKAPGELPAASLTADVGNWGQKKAQATVSKNIGDAAFTLSASVFNNSGPGEMYFPQYDSPATNNGVAVNVDGEQGYHLFANLTWHDWTFTAVFGERMQVQPISWGETIFGDRGNKIKDTRDYMEALYARNLGPGMLRWRTYYDSHLSWERSDFALPDSEVEENLGIWNGKWVGSEISYRFDVPLAGTVTAGVEGKVDLTASQLGEDIAPVPLTYVSTNNPDKLFALFLQDERRLGRHWTLDLGARYDYSALRADFFSPRAALIFQPSSQWTYKFLFGRGFRNPSAFEMYFGDGITAVANTQARPEKADTIEFDLERNFGKRLKFSSAAYGYKLRNMLIPERASDGLIQYQNVGRLHAEGVEIELDGHPAWWLQMTGSYAVQATKDDVEKDWVENSPRHLAKLKFAVPLGRKLELSSGMQYQSALHTLANAWTTPGYRADFTLTSRHLSRNLDFQLGIRNALNRVYYSPVALSPLVDAMQQPGRSFYLRFMGRVEAKTDTRESAAGNAGGLARDK